MFDFQRVKGIVIESRYPVGYFNDWAHIIQKGICLFDDMPWEKHNAY
jgi:hypothetical protein